MSLLIFFNHCFFPGSHTPLLFLCKNKMKLYITSENVYNLKIDGKASNFSGYKNFKNSSESEGYVLH